MGAMASQITGVSMVCSTVCSGADQRKHQISASLAFVRGIHRWPVNSPHKGPIKRKMFPFDDVIMTYTCIIQDVPSEPIANKSAISAREVLGYILFLSYSRKIYPQKCTYGFCWNSFCCGYVISFYSFHLIHLAACFRFFSLALRPIILLSQCLIYDIQLQYCNTNRIRIYIYLQYPPTPTRFIINSGETPPLFFYPG